MFAYQCTHGSNLDLADEGWDAAGRQLSLDRDIYPNYDIILCISTFSATAPLDGQMQGSSASAAPPCTGSTTSSSAPAWRSITTRSRPMPNSSASR